MSVAFQAPRGLDTVLGKLAAVNGDAVMTATIEELSSLAIRTERETPGHRARSAFRGIIQVACASPLRATADQAVSRPCARQVTRRFWC